MLVIYTSSLRSKAREVCQHLIRPPTVSRLLGIPRFYRKSEHPNAVAKYDTVRVLPNAKKPKGLYTLSNIDQTMPLPLDILFAFQTNSSLAGKVDVGHILKKSLRKALEMYYPLAGRVKEEFGGKMVVDCNIDGGIPFSEAFSDEDMAAAVGDITMIDRKLAKKLVYDNHIPIVTGLDVPPLAIQVNRFRCGGMILGVTLNHVMFDGRGLTDFMKSWSEIARGVPLSIKPHLDRSILSPRESLKYISLILSFLNWKKALAPPYPHEREKFIVNKSFIFTPTMLSRLRELGMQKSEPDPRAPTTFELISALTWICWTKANKLGPDETSRIGIPVDGRHKLTPLIPRGYFGNCIIMPCAQSRARDLTSQPLSYAVGTVHDAVKEVTGDYIRSVIDYLEMTRKPLDRNNVVWLSTMTRLPFLRHRFWMGGCLTSRAGRTYGKFQLSAFPWKGQQKPSTFSDLVHRCNGGFSEANYITIEG